MEKISIIKNLPIYKIPVLTEDEKTTLQKFKDFINSKKLEYNQEKFGDSVLIRYLRARKYDLNKSYQMILNTLKWQKEIYLDQIFKYEFPELPQVKKFYPHGFHKVDKIGRPIYFEISGNLEVDEMFKITQADRMLRYKIRQHEYLMNFIFPACSEKANSYINQNVSIFDLKKHTTKFMSKKLLDFLRLLSGFSQDHYPEILGALYIINSGMMFKVVWTAIKPFLDDKTKKKIVTLGGDYKKKLLEIIDEENLPSILGGKCECPGSCIYSGEGPWKNYVNEDIKKIDNWEKIELNFGFFNFKNEIDVIENVTTFEDNLNEENISNNGEFDFDDKNNLDCVQLNHQNIDIVDQNLDKMLKDDHSENDEENKENLEKLSLHIKMKLNLENPIINLNKNIHYIDGQTPINTQEVIYKFFIIKSFNKFFIFRN